MDKVSLRSYILQNRKAMTPAMVVQKSKIITDVIKNLNEYREAECIYAYISTCNEVDLRCLIEDAWTKNKRVATPKVLGKNMSFFYINSYEDLVEGRFGILEPADNMQQATEKDSLMLIPGIAYDKCGNRIGYGGGFYDRYLAEDNRHYKIAPAYELQLVDMIMVEEHDIRADKIISEFQSFTIKK